MQYERLLSRSQEPVESISHPSRLPSLLSLFWKTKEGLWDHLAVCVPAPNLLVFCAVRVISKARRRLVLLRTPFCMTFYVWLDFSTASDIQIKTIYTFCNPLKRAACPTQGGLSNWDSPHFYSIFRWRNFSAVSRHAEGYLLVQTVQLSFVSACSVCQLIIDVTRSLVVWIYLVSWLHWPWWLLGQTSAHC
jgi:hypothetical protein